jgi:integrase/recombinase XerD
VSTHIQSWLTHLEDKGKSAHTVAAYRCALAHFTSWNIKYSESFNLASIIPRDVQDWKGYQQVVEKAAPGTINQRLAALSRFFAWAVSKGIVHSDPTGEVQTIRLPQRKPKGLNERELRKLLRVVYERGDKRDYAILEVLVGTGLRVSELLALQIGDLVIRERSGKVVVRKGKHGGYREVPLTAHVRKALTEYLNIHPDPYNPQAAVWIGQRGVLQDRSAITRMLEKYALTAGLEPFGPHVLRHTFSSRYLAANPGDLRGLAALFGHANLNTVMIYTEPDLDDLAGRMER